MNPLHVLFRRVSTACDLLGTIVDATARGVHYQLDYACAVGEWRARRTNWFVNDEGIAPVFVSQVVSSALQQANVNAVASGAVPLSAVGGGVGYQFPYPMREGVNLDPYQDYVEGFTFKSAVETLQSRLGAPGLRRWKTFPNNLIEAYNRWFELPRADTATDPGEQFPNAVQDFTAGPLYTAIHAAHQDAIRHRDNLRSCLEALGCAPAAHKSPTVEQRGAEHEQVLQQLRTLAQSCGQDPFENLLTVGNQLCEALETECCLPWPTRYRRQIERFSVRLDSFIDQRGCEALARLSPTRLGDSQGSEKLVACVQHVQQLAAWSFFRHFCANPPQVAYMDRCDQEEPSAAACGRYLAELWLPARQQLNVMQQVVKGWYTPEQNTGPKPKIPGGKPPGPKPKFSEAIRAQVKQLHVPRRRQSDILVALQNYPFDDAKDRAAVATMTADDIATMRNTLGKKARPRKRK